MTVEKVAERPPSTDPRWAEAIAIANIPTLLMVLVQMTGELRWLDDPYRPSRTQGNSDNDSGQLPESVQHEIRTAALEAVRAWVDGRPLAIPSPSPELIVDMMSVSLGETIPPEYASLIAGQLNPHGDLLDEGAGVVGTAEADQPVPSPGFEVAIIGAGMSGLCAAVHLQNAGIPYTIFEKHDSVGGTWLENSYPGCGVDVPSHLYSFSFAPNDWSHYFSLRDEIHAYFERVADEFSIRQNIRFGAEVVAASYDPGAQEWAIEVTNPDGLVETRRASIVISAVGAFNKPKMPDVQGLGTFEGPSVHTAMWPAGGVELAGKRVAVIGSGASAMQVVPAIADEVESMVIVQRSKQWAAPFEKFRVPVPEPIRFLLRELPMYYAWYRLRLNWAFNDKIFPALQKDPEWPHPERAVNSINDGHRRYFTRYIVNELGDRQDLLDLVLPHYPPFGKRMLLDNGWYRTIKRDHVELVNDSVVEVQPQGIVTRLGRKFDVDVLIWATGFDVVHFLAPMEIRGRSGQTIHEAWDGDDARAYLGTVVPDFPNFFCLYGPNTQFGHGGSLISVVERQIHYVMSVIRQMVTEGIGSVEVRRDVHDVYNRRVDEAHANMVWSHPGMETYYRNSKGRVVVNNPFRIVDVWSMTDAADLSEYQTEPALDRVLDGSKGM